MSWTTSSPLRHCSDVDEPTRTDDATTTCARRLRNVLRDVDDGGDDDGDDSDSCCLRNDADCGLVVAVGVVDAADSLRSHCTRVFCNSMTFINKK